MALRTRSKASLGEMISKSRGKNESRTVLGDIENRQNTTKTKLEAAKTKLSRSQQKPNKIKHILYTSNDQTDTDNMEVDVDDDPIHDIDKEDERNPQMVGEYASEIFKYMRQIERRLVVRADFLGSEEGELRPRMRSILMDWLVGVHHEFKLIQETLFLTVIIIDRYLSLPEVAEKTERKNLQLVGITALLLASKYEEIYAPEVNDLVYISDNTYTHPLCYTADQIQAMERRMLWLLEFSLGSPLPVHFLRRASRVAEVEADVHTLAKYVMELAVVDYSMVSTPSSILAAAALLLALKLRHAGVPLSNLWTSTLVHYTGYGVEDLRRALSLLAKVLAAAGEAKLQNVRRKYTGSKFMKIALLPNLDNAVDLVSRKLNRD